MSKQKFCFSVCETASVASDLTRMYVSDEEDKPEMLLISPPVEEFEHHHTDTGDLQDAMHFDEKRTHTFGSKAKKRPRLHFSPPPSV